MVDEVQDLTIQQVAVVPYRVRNGALEIWLITTLRTGRWTIPKGIIESHLGLEDSAIVEAYEEAGLRGSFEQDLMGVYTYPKWGKICRVEVYPLRVTGVLETWPEAGQRKRCLVSVEEAITLVERPEVCGPIGRVAETRFGVQGG